MTDSLNEAVLVLKSLPKNEAAKIMSKLDIKDIRKVMQSSDKIGDRSEQDVLNALSRLSVEAGAISQKSGQTKQIASEKITSGPEQLARRDARTVIDRRASREHRSDSYLLAA